MMRAVFVAAMVLAAWMGKPAAGVAPMASEQSVAPSPHASLDTSPGLGDSLTLLPRGRGVPAQGLAALGNFASIAVLHEGRIKPLETLARHLLLQWYGRSAYKKKSALEVLAEILFAPEKTGDYKLFRIDNPEVAEALRIEPDKHRRYSYREIEPALHRLQAMATRADSVKPEKRNLVEKEVLRTYANVIAFLNLTRTFQYARPSDELAISHPETRAFLRLPPGDDSLPTFWGLMERAPLLAQILEGIGKRPDTSRSFLEEDVVALSRTMYLQSQMGQASLLCLLPDPTQPEAWISPAEIIADPARLPKLNAEIGFLAGMTGAYRRGNAEGFAQEVDAFKAGIEKRAFGRLEKTRFPLEILYGRANPIFWANVSYWLSLFLCFFFFLWRRRALYLASSITAYAALAIHIGSIVARILIMRRPPVTSLFETFPFVAAVAIAVALFMERRTRQGVALLAASLLGVVLLSIANRYAADGDTLQMLVAVLNSNFWLSTHVLCITTGYAACLLSGAFGHVYLIRNAIQGKSPALREIDRMVFGTLCFGLLFSFIGTVLGGIWADQSWGRFWGWDPKENGALLIVIWCAILLHARMFGLIKDLGMAMGSVFGAIIVSLAWLGVNLLNVGLHSYGFTTGAALKLFGYIGGELLFILLTGAVIFIRGKRGPGAGVQASGATTIATP